MRHAVDLLQLRHVPSSILCRAEDVVAADPYLITLFPIGEGQVGIEVASRLLLSSFRHLNRKEYWCSKK